MYCIHIYGSKFVCLASYHLLRPSFTASPGQAPPWACVFPPTCSRVEEFLRTALVNICHRAYTWFAYFGQEAATFPASQNMLGIRQANSAFSQQANFCGNANHEQPWTSILSDCLDSDYLNHGTARPSTSAFSAQKSSPVCLGSAKFFLTQNL